MKPIDRVLSHLFRPLVSHGQHIFPLRMLPMKPLPKRRLSMIPLYILGPWFALSFVMVFAL